MKTPQFSFDWVDARQSVLGKYASLSLPFKACFKVRCHTAGKVQMRLIASQALKAKAGSSPQGKNRVDAMTMTTEAEKSFFELGMMYATGRELPCDLVSAHKWFNIAAVRGDRDAIRMRAEIAGEMSSADIAAAQRAAREWLSIH